MTALAQRVRAAWSWLLPILSVAVLVITGAVLGALAMGYRPVVIQTGSMGDAAPAGSLIIAQPRDADQIVPGHILVMQNAGAATVTHRVVEVEQQNNSLFAITKGDANEAADPAPYALSGDQLTSRWVLPGWGFRLQSATQPGVVLFVVAAGVLAVTAAWIRHIWRDPEGEEAVASAPQAKSETTPSRRRRVVAVAALPLLSVTTAGVAWALFQSSDSVSANQFSTLDCFDAQLGSVQDGQMIHATSGVVTIPIAAVDPGRSFVMASVRSDANESADSSVAVNLGAAGTVVEISRPTDAGVPPPVTVAWSVVEYSCGVSVQRGSATGNGAPQIDLALSTAPLDQSFVLFTTASGAADSDFGGEDMFVAELTSPTNLQIRSGFNTDVGRSFEWQVVTFEDPGDIQVQTATATMASGSTAISLPLAQPADLQSTFVIASSTSATAAGPALGDRAIRAHLDSTSSVAVQRQIDGDDLDISVQVITLTDGSSVHHGTVDFAPGQAARTVSHPPVDPARSTATLTVALPGATAGGSTDMASDDVLGEASATAAISAPDRTLLAREATLSSASFGWQVIEWAGPGWWNGSYDFRQRIDVTSIGTAVPGGYTVPLTVDHAALVSLGLSVADGDDVRIMRWDGAAWTELDRVLDDSSIWNDTNTTLLFRTQDAIAADATDSYWLYFGNDTPPAPADDPEGVFVLYEDFESGTLGDFEDRTGNSGWYEADAWTGRIVVTIDSGSVPVNQTDMPTLIELSDPDLAARAQTDGSDIRFTAADGTTPLVHEIEWWDASTGSLAAWVRVPAVTSSSDTIIHLYYGAADAPQQADTRLVWDDDFANVWHLANDPGGVAPQVDDSTTTNTDGLSRGSMTAGNQIVGTAGRGLQFDGVDDALELGPLALGGSDAFTWEAWVRPDAVTGTATLFAKGAGANSVLLVSLDQTGPTTAELRADLTIDGATATTIASAWPLTSGTWHHVAVTFDGAAVTAWVDGLAGISTFFGGSPTISRDSSIPAAVGDLPGGGGAPFNGAIDEIRISNVVRDPGWIATNMANINGFITVAPPETGVWLHQGSWLYRKQLQVDPALVDGNVSNLPVLVELTDPDLQGASQSDADDVVFTLDDGVTRVDHVVEDWDALTGTLSAWVLLPQIDATTGADFYVYYGNALAVDQTDPAGVFGPAADLTLLLGG